MTDHNAAATNPLKHRVEGNVLVLEREFDAPRELVFKAFTEPDRIVQWWGPREWRTTNKAMDVRPGGAWHYCMTGPDGTESWGYTEYKEVDPPSRLVYTDAFSDADGNINPDLPVSTTVMTLEDVGGKTKIVSRTEYASAADLKSVMDMGMLQGITETWDRLAEHLAGA